MRSNVDGTYLDGNGTPRPASAAADRTTTNSSQTAGQAAGQSAGGTPRPTEARR